MVDVAWTFWTVIDTRSHHRGHERTHLLLHYLFFILTLPYLTSPHSNDSQCIFSPISDRHRFCQSVVWIPFHQICLTLSLSLWIWLNSLQSVPLIICGRPRVTAMSIGSYRANSSQAWQLRNSVLLPITLNQFVLCLRTQKCFWCGDVQYKRYHDSRSLPNWTIFPPEPDNAALSVSRTQIEWR